MKNLLFLFFCAFTLLLCESCGNAAAETTNMPTMAYLQKIDSARTPTLEQKIAALQSLQKDDLKQKPQVAQSKPAKHKRTQQVAAKPPEGVKLQRVSGNFTVSGNTPPKP